MIIYKANIAITRPTKPPAEPIKGTLLTPAALEDDVVAADPVAVEPEDFVPNLRVSTTHFRYHKLSLPEAPVAADPVAPVPVAVAEFAVTLPEAPPAAATV